MDGIFSMNDTTMVAALIGVLTCIFICALIGLLVVCKRLSKRQEAWDRFDNDSSKSKKKHLRKYPEADLAMTLTDIGLSNALDHILSDDQWVDDASGLIPHCLSVLRTCHTLTERLAGLAMRPIEMKVSPNRLIEAAKRIPFRVDDVVRSMYPPLDARLLEARLSALVLAVGQLALLAQSISEKHHLDWIDDSLIEMDKHLLVLRQAAVEIDEQNRNGTHFNSSQV